jgi:hypothetical protein
MLMVVLARLSILVIERIKVVVSINVRSKVVKPSVLVIKDTN